MSNFDLQGTLDAINFLTDLRRVLCTGPHVPWRIVTHALDRLEAQVNEYLTGKK